MHFSLDGERVEGRVGDSLAAAMLRAGVTTFTRSIKYHRPRGPFCLTGTCGQCLVRVDGVPSVPACRVGLGAGMECERQNAALGSVDGDLMRAADFLFPKGLDHHHLMIQSRLLGKVTLEVARRLAGLGEVPDLPQGAIAADVRSVDVAIVGAGPAGLSAARAALDAGAGALALIEGDSAAGGAVRWGLIGGDLVAARALGEELGERLWLRASLVALHAEEGDEAPARLLVRRACCSVLVKAKRVVLALGGASQPLPFPGGDRPGIYAARGLLALHERSGVRVGGEAPSLALVGEGEELVRCARALEARGYAIGVAIDVGRDPVQGSGREILSGRVVRVRGDPVRELQVSVGAPGSSGTLKKFRCDAVAIALPLAPLHEPGSGVGARTRFDPGSGAFPLEVDGDGRTSVPWIFACGTVAGLGGARAPASGAAAGRAAAADLGRTGARS